MTDPSRRVGTFSVHVEVGDPSGQRFKGVDAFVDTGASHTMLPGSLLRSLGVAPYRTMAFELADGSVQSFELGRTWVRIEGHIEVTQVAFGTERMPILLGAITLEQLSLAVDPVTRRLVPTRPPLLLSRRAA